MENGSTVLTLKSTPRIRAARKRTSAAPRNGGGSRSPSGSRRRGKSVMARKSAGILLYRFRDGRPEVFLVHPGGPFWAKKEQAAWSIPKGEFGDPEDPIEAARREFREETGFSVNGDFIEL